MAETGDFAEGLDAVQNALPLARASDQPFNVAAVYLSLSQLYQRQGRFAEAVGVLEPAVELSKEKSVQTFLPFLTSALGLARCRAGLVGQGLALLEDSARALLMVVLGKARSSPTSLKDTYARAAAPTHWMQPQKLFRSHVFIKSAETRPAR